MISYARFIILFLILINLTMTAQISLDVLRERQDYNSRRIDKIESENTPVRMAKIEAELNRISTRLDRLENLVLGGLLTIFGMFGQKLLEWFWRSRERERDRTRDFSNSNRS